MNNVTTRFSNLLKTLVLSIILFGCKSAEDSPETGVVLQALLDAYTDDDRLPGVVLYVQTPEQSYYLSSGMRDRSTAAAMQTTTLAYPQSISKSFTAVAILKLQEAGELNVNDKMNQYLPDSICGKITNGNIITIRQLLNHTSGIKDYVYIEQFQNDVFSGELFPMTAEKVLSYIYGTPADFLPGTEFGYTDTNYHLLALIIDKVTGDHHGAYFQSEIIDKLDLQNTYYLPYNSPASDWGNSYMFNESHQYEDITEIQFMLTQGGIGADGLLCQAQDLAIFYAALIGDKTLLQDASLKEMQKFPFAAIPYGMGLVKKDFAKGGVAYGHDGGGLGAGAFAYYFPDQSTSVVLMTNVGVILSEEKAETMTHLLEDIIQNTF